MLQHDEVKPSAAPAPSSGRSIFFTYFLEKNPYVLPIA
jgi:hypothetical protein